MAKLFFSTLILICFLLGPVSATAQEGQNDDLRELITLLQQQLETLQSRVAQLERLLQERLEEDGAVIRPGNWQALQNWREIRRDQTMDQVRDVLGDPTRVESGRNITTWFWGTENRGSIQFSAYTNRVVSWAEPNFEAFED